MSSAPVASTRDGFFGLRHVEHVPLKTLALVVVVEQLNTFEGLVACDWHEHIGVVANRERHKLEDRRK